jgi:nicotinamidase-related amidase
LGAHCKGDTDDFPPQTQYLEPITRDNAAVLFIDNQNHLLMGVQSIDTTLLRLNTEALAKLAELYGLPVVLTTTGGGAEGAWGPLLKPITDTFPDAPIFNRQPLNAMNDPGFADACERPDGGKSSSPASRPISASSFRRSR